MTPSANTASKAKQTNGHPRSGQALPVKPASAGGASSAEGSVQPVPEVHTLNQRHGNAIVLPARKGNILGGLRFTRCFSSDHAHPYDEVHWERRDIEIRGKGGVVVFSRSQVEVPTSWDESSISILSDKYLFGAKPGSPEFEDSFKNPFDRIANTYTVWGWEEGYFVDEADALIFNEEIKAMLVKQIWAPNSPVWFNLGHWEQWRWGRPDLREVFRGRGNEAFFAKGTEGNFKIFKAESGYANPQASACFLSECEDSLEAIQDHYKTEGRIFGSGSGIGINVSTLRSTYEPINGKGVSSGPLSFNAAWDKNGGAIKSGGKTRRAARMVICDSDHPNVFDFVVAKNNQENIAKIILREHNVNLELRALAKNKLVEGSPSEKIAAQTILNMPVANEISYSSHMDDFLYSEVLSNQNANHSISLKGDFWKAFQIGGEYSTRMVTKPDKVVKKFPAHELIDAMAKSCWENGEPGVHNNDWINLWSTFKEIERLTTSNPCSEYIAPNNTSCNLSSFNLIKFLIKSQAGIPTLDVEKLRHGVRLALVCADLNVERGGFPIEAIAVGTYRFRTTGIGYANLGGLLMSLGIPYDSDEGRWIASQITSLMTATCWETSAELGEALGSYPAFEKTENSLRSVHRLHAASQRIASEVLSRKPERCTSLIEEICAKDNHLPEAQGITGRDALVAFLNNFENIAELDQKRLSVAATTCEAASKAWNSVLERKKFRNSFVSCIAPTGTISGIMGIFTFGTTSAEPDYQIVKYKQMSGGGFMKMFNALALEGLRTQGYSEELIREAAFEVAGMDGLLAACGQSQAVMVRHLLWSPRTENRGPVRNAFIRLANTDATQESIQGLVTDLKARQYNPANDAEKLVIGGKNHVEALPWLRAADLAAFDCASTSGDGKRYIRVEGHIKMLGALQPFICGATSKTVNLPSTATVDEIKRCIILAHELGVKCTAMFRDQSKANAVFQSDSPEARKFKAPHLWSQMVASTEATMSGIVAEASKPKQRKLPGRRLAETVKFSINGGQLGGFITVGIYPEGTCGEVLGRLGQVGSFPASMFEAYCKMMSLALQFGVPLKQVLQEFNGMDFEPKGWSKIGDDNEKQQFEEVRSASSVVDLMVKILAWLFPEENGYRLRELNSTAAHFEWAPNKVITVAPDATKAGTNGDNASHGHSHAVHTPVIPSDNGSPSLANAGVCPSCGALALVPSGKCRVCLKCGKSDGGCG